MDTLDLKLKAKSGSTLRVLGIARVSKPSKDGRCLPGEKEPSLEDQEALYRGFIEANWRGRYVLDMIATQGSGEWLDRKEIQQFKDAVASEEYDLVTLEDLGRAMRRTQAFEFCEDCEDHATRLIALNDSVDTAKEDWRMSAFFAVMRHELYNADTAKRITRSLTNQFLQGRALQFTIFGYIKPPGCKHDSAMRKEESAEPIIEEMVRLLEQGATYCEVADWLNEIDAPVGKYCRKKRWDGPMVARFIDNPILKGYRRRNRMKAKRINKTGRRKMIKVPVEQQLRRHCPHLAFVEEQRYDRLIRVLRNRNGGCSRKIVNGRDCRAGVAKKRTRWPGDHIICGKCGRNCRFGSHGQVDGLGCAGSYAYTCWNGVSLNGPRAAQKIIAAVREHIAALPEFPEVLRTQIHEALKRRVQESDGVRQELERRRGQVQRQLENVKSAVREAGPSATLIETLNECEFERDEINRRLKELAKSNDSTPELPTMDELKRRAFDQLNQLAVSSQEFGRLMRVLLPRLEMRPVRCCDGGLPLPRAYITLSLASLIDTPQSNLLKSQDVEFTVDLFDPPMHVAHREDVERLYAAGIKLREISTRLKIHLPTACRARALTKKMRELGLKDPYVELKEPPADFPKMCRHKHKRFRFEPLDGFPRAA